MTHHPVGDVSRQKDVNDMCSVTRDKATMPVLDTAVITYILRPNTSAIHLSLETDTLGNLSRQI
jgi:hypothetical protein